MSSPRPEEGASDTRQPRAQQKYLSPRMAQRSASASRLRKRSRPHLMTRGSMSAVPGASKLKYSVDDDVNDTMPHEEYIEGYNDALRELMGEDDGDSPQVPATPTGTECSDDEGDDAASMVSNSSSLNLQQRQDAINSTHPFGIKIWKPSVYKKNRSVAQRADEDIHDYQPQKPGRITWSVTITNILWMCSAGALLWVMCMLGAVVVYMLSGFGIQKSSRQYVSLFFKLGNYFLWPFGKFVLLKRDKRYDDEDELDGRSISEFHQWRMQEEGRLFYAPPRRQTDGLLKDHKGRTLQDSFSTNSAQKGPHAQHQPSEPLTPEEEADEADAADDDQEQDLKVRLFGRGAWSFGRLSFYMFFYLLLQPVLYAISIVCWLVVFTIPMANITNTLCDHLRRHPLALDFEREQRYYQTRSHRKHERLIMCTYKCCGLHYYKYTIDGTNIFFVNLNLMVFFVIFDFYYLKEYLGIDSWYTDGKFVFCACLFSIIPLAYFIGQAVASISAQSSMGVGAVINAFFSTVVEIFLYCVALGQGKGKLVEGSMIGSILGGVCLLPGLSMCGGALKRKTQRYNPRSAGVSSTMLLFAMVIMFAPSLFYQIYGTYEIRCVDCDSSVRDCQKCRFIQPELALDKLYYSILRPFSFIVAIALFVAYVCGLYFTLRTHASLIWATSHDTAPKPTPSLPPATPSGPGRERLLPPSASFRAPSDDHMVGSSAQASAAAVANQAAINHSSIEEEAAGGHDAPNWSKTKSTVILLGATMLYAVIAEILVNCVDAVLVDYPINPKFLGLTVFALVPNTTEFLNAISFAIGGNVALSMEIGSAYALQVVLIQIPALVLYSIYTNFDTVDKIFSLVFPRWDIIATLISIYLFTYIYAEGKSNYFKGFILILIYFVVLIGFYFNDLIASLDDGYSVLSLIPDSVIF